VILHPSILALAISSLLICLMVLYSTFYGIRILRDWDIASGSERQLELERRTYLLSTIVSYFLALQLISLFFFIFTADSICKLFVGAMCAVGTLSVNGFGYPTLLLKIITFILAGLWLILNHADNQGYDYPLIRKKYLMLAVLAPLILLETVVQSIYFVGLKPDIITSCCGSLFSTAGQGIATEIASLPALPILTLFYVSALVTFAAGLRFYCRESGGYIFAILSGSHLLVAIVAIISVFSLYIYQMPSHHCPFCILQKEYYFIGYPIYIAILVGGVTGLGTGMLMPFRAVASLREILPGILRNLTLTSLASLLFLTLLVSWPVVGTSFTLR